MCPRTNSVRLPTDFMDNGLVEQVERLLVVDPEAAAEPRAVRREGVPDLDPGARAAACAGG